MYFYYVLDRRKIHFLFPDGTEMCEEYDLESNLLLGKCTYHMIAFAGGVQYYFFTSEKMASKV